MVILQKILENRKPEKDMGNRGSKSAPEFISYICIPIRNSHVLEAVKEQRVDGSCIGISVIKIKFPMLRCTLMGFEINYPIKILSNQINKVRWYTSISSHKPIITPQFIQNPWFITGFSDAESSFSILIQANSQYTTG